MGVMNPNDPRTDERIALDYIASPTCGWLGGFSLVNGETVPQTIEAWIKHDCPEHLVRAALLTCIRIAKQVPK